MTTTDIVRFGSRLPSSDRAAAARSSVKHSLEEIVQNGQINDTCCSTDTHAPRYVAKPQAGRIAESLQVSHQTTSLPTAMVQPHTTLGRDSYFLLTGVGSLALRPE